MAIIPNLIKKRAKEAIKVLSERANVKMAYLFGSYVTGNFDEYSDVDVAVFIEDNEKWNLEHRAEMSAEVQSKVGDDIELHYFSSVVLDKLEPSSFASHIVNHGKKLSIE